MKKIFFFLGLALALVLSGISVNNVNASTLGILWVNAETDQIQGSGWMTGANVVVKIGEDEFPIAAGENGDFVLTLTGTGYDITPGTVVTATHAGQTTTPYTVTNLAFDSDFEYPNTTVVKGSATPGSTVRLYLSSFGQGGREWLEIGEGGAIFVEKTADGQGKWQHDFAGFRGDLESLDVHAFQPNKESISTFVVRTGDPGSLILGVYPQINTIWGHSWPYGNLTLTVTRGAQTFSHNYGLHSGGDFRIHYDIHKINIEVGDTVTAKIGDLAIAYKVLGLRVSSVDTTNNVIQGVGEPNKAITVGLGADGMENQRFVTSGADGTWSVNFSTTQQAPWGEILQTANITNTTPIWVYQGVAVSVPGIEYAEGRTIVTNYNNLLSLVRSFIITRMTEFAAMTSNIATVLDDPSQKLIFESPNFGRVEFSSFDIETLLVINPEFLENLPELIKITFDSENKTVSTKVDTSTLDFLSGHGATIQFFNVAKSLGVTGLTKENIQEYLDIKVYDDGTLVTNLADYFDWDKVTYDPETDILTLPVNHFTEYVLGQRTELPETGSAIIGIVSLGLISLTAYAILKRYKVLV